MQKQKITSDAIKPSAKPNSGGLQVKSVSTVGNINVGLKAVPQSAANASETKGPKVRSKRQNKVSKAEKPAKSTTAQAENKTSINSLLSKSSSISSSRLPLIGGIVGVCVVFLLVLLVAGGSDTTEVDAAPVVTQPKAPIAPIANAEAEAVKPVEPLAVSKSEESPASASGDAPAQSTQLMMGNIISALRHHDNQPESAGTDGNAASEVELTSVSNLAKIVVTAMEQGQSEAYIQQLLNEAQANGEIRVPAPLLRPDGSVDTGTILSLFSKN